MANVEALEQLRRVVKAAPESLFDMSWYGKRTDCGTACCAAGWAALDPWFLCNTDIAKVLPVNEDPESDEVFEIDFGLCDSPLQGFMGVFGLDYDDANYLFNGPTAEGVPKEDVLDNIDRVIAGQPALPYRIEDEEDWR